MPSPSSSEGLQALRRHFKSNIDMVWPTYLDYTSWKFSSASTEASIAERLPLDIIRPPSTTTPETSTTRRTSSYRRYAPSGPGMLYPDTPFCVQFLNYIHFPTPRPSHPLMLQVRPSYVRFGVHWALPFSIRFFLPFGDVVYSSPKDQDCLSV